MEVAYTPAQIGQNVVIRAAVYQQSTGRLISQGTMQFTADGQTIPGCESVWVFMSSGAAECKTAFQKLGAVRLEATYSGFGALDSSSRAADIAVGKLFPWSYIAFIPSTPVYGSGLIVNAKVLGAEGMPKPTGTFTFSEGGKEISTSPIGDADEAPMGKFLPTGTHRIDAIYNGDDLYLPSAVVSTFITVVKGPATVAISSTPGQVRQPVTITASVLPAGASGAITFTGVPGCGAVPLKDGIATCAATFNQLGDVPVTASYSGDSNLLAGSAAMKLNVGRVVAGVYVAFTPAATVYGQAVQVGALALGAPGVAPPTGMVGFRDELGNAGAAVLSREGHADWTLTASAGTHLVVATYNGDGNYGTSQAGGTLVVGKASTVTMLAAPVGEPMKATVSAVAPGRGLATGTVRFIRDGATVGTAALQSGVATVVAPAGSGDVRAEYSGDLNFLPSVSGTTAVSAPRVDLRIMADRNPAPAGKVVLTVAATGNAAAAPTGSVQVSVDGVAAGGGPVMAGALTIAADLKPGAHTVAASYSGDALYPAVLASISLAVIAPAGTLALTANPASPVYGEPITFTAQLPEGSSGSVQFMDGVVPLGTTQGTLTVSRMATGTHTLTATWAGDARWSAAAAELTLAVAKARTTTTLNVSGGTAAVQVLPAAPGAGTPSGTVRFTDGVTGAGFASVPLERGMASTPMPPGLSLATAYYDGDLNFAASASGATGLLTVVNAASYAAGPFAPGELVTIFGQGMTGAESARFTDSSGVVRGADLLYATAGQASMLLPEALADGPAVLSMAGMNAGLTVARTAPGLFTADASGHGAPAAQVIVVHADGTQSTGSVDAIDLGGEGDAAYLVLYGTGIRHFAEKVGCMVGGRAATVVYAGPQSGAVGVDQVNVLLPAELRGAGRAGVVVTADGVASNTVTVVVK